MARTRLDLFTYSPANAACPAKVAEFHRAFAEAHSRWPDIKLEYIGAADGQHHFQRFRHPDLFLVPIQDA